MNKNVKFKLEGIKRMRVIITPYTKCEWLDGYHIGEPVIFEFENQKE
jgi:hypothetical protein